jgi:hypothetical protein
MDINARKHDKQEERPYLIFLGLSYVTLSIILSCDQFGLIVKVLATLGAAL